MQQPSTTFTPFPRVTEVTHQDGTALLSDGMKVKIPRIEVTSLSMPSLSYFIDDPKFKEGVYVTKQTSSSGGDTQPTYRFRGKPLTVVA